MRTEFISKRKIKLLEESIGFLSNYMPPHDVKVFHTVGENLEDIDLENTVLLNRLGQVNLERESLIAKLLSD